MERPARATAGRHRSREAEEAREEAPASKRPKISASGGGVPARKAAKTAAPAAPAPAPPPARKAAKKAGGGVPARVAPAPAPPAPAPAPAAAAAAPALPASVVAAFQGGAGSLRVTASACHGDYALNDKDLGALAVEYARNPHYRSAAPMRLYALADVRALCLQKYGSRRGLAEKLAKNASAAAKRRATLASRPPRYGGGGGGGYYGGGEGEYSDEDGRSENEECCHCCKESYGRGCCPRHD